jgi:hypothetical protein
MGIAGAGFGAARALEEIIGEQMLRAQMEAREREAQARTQLDREALQARIESDNANRGLRQQEIDMEAGDRRQKRNVVEVRRMLSDAIMQSAGGITPEMRRGMASLQVESGDAPTMLAEPKPERDPIADHRAKREIDAQFEKPTRERDPIADYLAKKEIDAKFEKPDRTSQLSHPQIAKYSENIIRKVDDLIGRKDDPATPQDESRPNRITHATAGVGGAVRRWAPWNNAAKDVDAELFSLTSELAISALQKMRASSQTGGGVGNVALGEMEIMKNAEAAIRSDQSPANLRRQLKIIRDSEQRFLDAVRADGMNSGVQIDSSGLKSEGGGSTAPAAAPKRLRFDSKGNPIP